MENKTKNYTHIFKYTGVFGGIQGLNILIGLVRNKLVALLLGPQGMGLVSLFSSAAKLVSDSTNLGLPMSAVRKISFSCGHNDDACVSHTVRLVRSWCLLVALVGMLVCICASNLLDRWTFSWGNHVMHFVLLSPLVGVTAVTAGELAVMKGMRCLGQLARCSIYVALLSTVISVPLYWIWGESGIIPSLVLAGVMQMSVTMLYSCRRIPYKVSLNPRFLSAGSDMVRIGIAFVMAGVVGSGADFLIRSYLNYHASQMVVGLFNAGYMLAVTYAGTVFSALESDYFPRLSMIGRQRYELCRLTNAQTEVAVIIITPLLVILLVCLPWLLPLLFSSQFLPVVGMVQVSSLSMFCKALYLPVEYIPLARGDSRRYFFLEFVADALMVLFVLVGYKVNGLNGAGWGILLSSIIETVIAYITSRYWYGFKLSSSLLRTLAVFSPWPVLACCFTSLDINDVVYGIGGASIVSITLFFSFKSANEKSDLWNMLKQKVKK